MESRGQFLGFGSFLPQCEIGDGLYVLGLVGSIFIVSRLASPTDVLKHAVACLSYSQYFKMYTWKSCFAYFLR